MKSLKYNLFLENEVLLNIQEAEEEKKKKIREVSRISNQTERYPLLWGKHCTVRVEPSENKIHLDIP